MAMAKKTAPRSKRHTQQASAGSDGLLEVTVVILEDGYASTAIAPIEIFHSAGVVWNWLNGDAEQSRFKVRTASIDGRKVKAAGSLSLTPDCAIDDIKHADIILVAAPGWDVLDHIAKNTALVPWLQKWHSRGAYIAAACTGVAFLAEGGMSMGGGQPRIGESPTYIGSAIPR
jgi:transcriptional regulator GlxA family with amidase domain